MLSITAFLLIDSFFVSPARFITRHVTIDNEQIPEQLDNMNILFFSDLKYGIYMNEERLNKLVDTINASGADVVLFGGDIYGDSVTVDDHSTSLITKAFSKYWNRIYIFIYITCNGVFIKFNIFKIVSWFLLIRIIGVKR